MTSTSKIHSETEDSPMNEDEWMIRLEKATEDNYIQFGFVLSRAQEIVDVINEGRRPSTPLVLTDPGNRYCAVATSDQSLILWFVDLKDGSILGATYGIPGGPTKYNIWDEDPTHCMGLMGIVKELRGVPFKTTCLDRQDAQDLSQKSHYEPCDKSNRGYINYALEA